MAALKRMLDKSLPRQCLKSASQTAREHFTFTHPFKMFSVKEVATRDLETLRKATDIMCLKRRNQTKTKFMDRMRKGEEVSTPNTRKRDRKSVV